jgi:hypothetical protein
VSSDGLPQESERRPPITLICRNDFKGPALVVHGAPEIARDAVDLHEDLVEAPPPFGTAETEGDAPLPDRGGEQRPKSIPP